MIIQIIFLIIGFVMLIKGADVLVDGSSSLARRLKVSSLVIGLTIVAFGTSAPELAISFKALISGSGDIVLGNVIGSNIANTLLVIGVGSLFCSLKVREDTVKKQIPITILISTLLAVLFSDNIFDKNDINLISRSDGIVILLFFTIFIYYLFIIIKKNRELKMKNSDVEVKPKYTMLKSIIFIILGLAALVFGSNLVVDSASKIASILGISERIISFTIIALGTSLPELVTSIVSARKGENDILLGNIIGSNIFNIGIVLALPVAIFGSISGIGFSYADVIMLVMSSILLYIFAKDNREISKFEGIVLIVTFIVYYTFVIFV